MLNTSEQYISSSETKSFLQAQIINRILEPHRNKENLDEILRVASAAHLARRVAYELDEIYFPNTDRTIAVYDEDGIIRDYKIDFIYTMHLGIVPYILTSDDPSNNRIHLVFRGTKDSPAWCRNTEAGGPGHMSFYADKANILDYLCTSLDNLACKSRIKLIISGHSLGGSDAQNCATAVITALAHTYRNNPEYKAYTALQRINVISVNHANSGGVTNLRATECRLHAEYLTKEMLVVINILAIITAGDGVQQSGQTHILHNATPDVARYELVKLSSDHSGWITKSNVAIATLTLPYTYLVSVALMFAALRGAYKAHSMRFFDHTQFKEQSYEMYTNYNEDGRLKIIEKLTKHPLDNPVFARLQHGIHMLQTYLFETRRKYNQRQYEDYVIITTEDAEGAEISPSATDNETKESTTLEAYKCLIQ